jgi:hypothetical protein
VILSFRFATGMRSKKPPAFHLVVFFWTHTFFSSFVKDRKALFSLYEEHKVSIIPSTPFVTLGDEIQRKTHVDKPQLFLPRTHVLLVFLFSQKKNKKRFYSLFVTHKFGVRYVRKFFLRPKISSVEGL